MKLITLVVTLALVTSAVSGEELSTKDCKVIWEKYENMQVQGLTKIDSIKTELECKAACEAGDNCWNIDFNFREVSCWHGIVHKPTGRIVDNSVHHWDMTKDCTTFQKVKTECVLTWEKYANTKVRYLSQQDGITNEDDCKKACEGKDNCWNIDFNFHSISCWHGSAHKPTSRVSDNTVNHWDLSKICKVVPVPPTFADCGAIQRADPSATSGTYGITVPGVAGLVQVYCDMKTSGGGWTVFQRRIDGSGDFDRTWADYANGFGNLDKEFWLGNDYISALTKSGNYRLRIDLGNFNGQYRIAEYNNFVVNGAAAKYNMTFSKECYFGNAGDSLSSHWGMKFSTKDQDNDAYEGNCAKSYHSGWWFRKCYNSNLNGPYDNKLDGVIWGDWLGLNTTLRFSEMKIRSAYYL